MEKKHCAEEHYTDVFRKLLREIKGIHFSIIHEVYNKIISIPQEEKVPALMAICETYGTVKPNNDAAITKSPYLDKLAALRERKSEAIQSKIASYIGKNNSRKIFYKKCYNYIFESKTLKCDEERIFALYLLIMDRRIPYYPYDVSKAYEMDNERFRDIFEHSKQELKLLQTYSHQSFPQKTMQASVILDILGIKRPTESDNEKVAEYEKQLILMSYILFTNK